MDDESDSGPFIGSPDLMEKLLKEPTEWSGYFELLRDIGSDGMDNAWRTLYQIMLAQLILKPQQKLSFEGMEKLARRYADSVMNARPGEE